MSKQTSKTGLSNILGNDINPATEDKQDNIISNISPSIDLECGGIISVGTTAVEVTFTGTTQSIHIQAHPNNSGILYIGKSNITDAGDNVGAILQPGDDIVLHYNDINNSIYIVSDTAAQEFLKMALL